MDYLEHLAQLLSCEYLSDLRYHGLTHAEAARILTEPERFPEVQYQEAARYILGSAGEYASSLEARQAIVAYLRRQQS